MKPKPFMSLISVILPVPWVLKWFSTSALVAAVKSGQRCQAMWMGERVGVEQHGRNETRRGRQAERRLRVRGCGMVWCVVEDDEEIIGGQERDRNRK